MADEGAVPFRRPRLPDVVKKGCQARQKVRRRPLDGKQRVSEDIVRVVAGLGHSLARGELEQDGLEQAGLVQELQRQLRARRFEHLAQLFGDPFGRDDGRSEARSEPAHRGHEVGRELESELGREADAAQHPQRVVGEGSDGVGGRAQQLRLEVLPGAEPVVDLPVHVHEQRVDGEIAAAKVLVKRGPADVGFARVGGVGLGPGGHELDQPARQGHLRGAEPLEGDRWRRAR